MASAGYDIITSSRSAWTRGDRGAGTCALSTMTGREGREQMMDQSVRIQRLSALLDDPGQVDYMFYANEPE
jgi:hypothetical protein